MKKKKGFTLTEILVVIVLIGVIMAIAIPSVVEVRKRINKRLLSEKKQEILVAAQLYGNDRKLTTDTYINVYTLLEDYIKRDVDPNNTNCKGSNTTNGCIINPVDDTSMNNDRILIRVNGKSLVAVWDDGSVIGGLEPSNLVEIVKSNLNCTEQNKKVDEGKCVYGLDNMTDPNNYLYYSGIMWRVLGVYKIDNKEVAKLISNDNVVWEISA